jgi:hypothetical protein
MRTVQRLQLHGGSERSGGHRDVKRAPQVVPLAGVHRVLEDVDLDVQVACGAAAGADLALAHELQAGAGVHSGGYLDVEGSTRANPAVPRALRARTRVDGAEAAALGTRPSGHDLAQEGTLDVADLPTSPADVTRDELAAVGGPASTTGRTRHSGVDLDLLGRAEHRRSEVDVHPQERVLPTPGATTRPAAAGLAEEGIEDVGEGEPVAGHAARSGAAAAQGVATQVVHLPLARVGEHLVGVADGLEHLLVLGVAADVRVVLASESTIGTLDVVGRGVAGYSEHLVVVGGHVSPSRVCQTPVVRPVIRPRSG